MPTGPWKEGRCGAASLCYWQLTAEQHSWVLDHHQAVGIRATMAMPADQAHAKECTERNWDCALLADAETANSGAGHIWLQAPPYPATLTNAAYLAHLGPGCMPAPQAVTTSALPAQYLPPCLELAQGAIETVVAQQAWAIWYCDGPQLAALRKEAHRQLLSWLGDHHARIWCAPIRDIANWSKGA